MTRVTAILAHVNHHVHATYVTHNIRDCDSFPPLLKGAFSLTYILERNYGLQLPYGEGCGGGGCSRSSSERHLGKRSRKDAEIWPQQPSTEFRNSDLQNSKQNNYYVPFQEENVYKVYIQFVPHREHRVLSLGQSVKAAQ